MSPKHSPRARLGAAALAAVSLLACSAPAPRAERAALLDEEVAALCDANAAGEFVRTVEQAERFLAQTDRSDALGARASLQAALEAGRAHARLAVTAPYLREPDADGVWQLSPIAHRMAMARYFSLARSLARRAATVEGAEELSEALRGADLAEFAFHAQLGLEPSCRAYMQRESELHDPRVAAELFQRLPLAGLRPWLYAELFDYQRARDERAAYRFAIMAIDEAPSATGFSAQRVAQLERWITGECSLEFHCPQCDLAVNPGLRACPNDRTPNVEFVGRKRL